MRWLYTRSIWHPSAISPIEGQTSIEMKRIVLPVFDVIIIGMAIGAVVNGMPSFEVFDDPIVSILAAWGLLIGALAAAVGIIFPALWVSEAAGKFLILVVLAGYSGALWGLVLQGDGGRVFAAGAFLALTIFPVWNLARLGRERRQRRAMDHIRRGSAS